MLLQDAMSKRLPPESLKGRNMILNAYEFAYGVFNMQTVANDLERLAKSLP